MLDMKFLQQRHKVAGLEFMDFQNSTFFQDLADSLASEITPDGILGAEPSDLMGIIKRYTGFENITLELSEHGNLAIDAGYINPGNLFNIKDIDRWLSRSQSTLGQWFKNNKDSVIKGEIDFTTGKVSGSYAELPFTMYINKDTSSYINKKVLEKNKVSIAEGLAATVIHELGHAFGGIMMIHQEASDNLIMRSAIHFLSEQSNTSEKVTVIKEARKLIDREAKNDDATDEQLAELDNVADYVVCFKKMAETRNIRRSLSLGVQTMNSEVIADAYSIRMGCGKSLIFALGGLFSSMNRDYLKLTFSAAIFNTVYTMYVTSAIALVGPVLVGLATLTLLSSMIYLRVILGTSEYNSPYRRMMNAFQEMIMKLKSDKTMTDMQRRKLVDQLNQAMAFIQKQKPLFEDTALQRFALWLHSGSDGKFINIDHYTQSIANHDINVVGAKLLDL